MTLEQQVCSLDLAKRLKELGVKQESFFYWYWNDENPPKIGYMNREFWEPTLAAFTVAELGEMLPDREIETFRHKGTWYCEYNPAGVSMQEGTEAAARAKMLIYLIDNNLITI